MILLRFWVALQKHTWLKIVEQNVRLLKGKDVKFKNQYVPEHIIKQE